MSVLSRRKTKRVSCLIVAFFVITPLVFMSMRGNVKAANAPHIPHINVLAPRYTILNVGSPDDVHANAGNSLTIPTWSSEFTYNGMKYPYTMVGTDPTGTPAVTKIPTEIVPLIVSFSSGVAFDGSKKVHATVTSPLFKSAQFTSGVTQYGDAIQRQEFWTSISKVRRFYHVVLSYPTILPTVVLNVPASKGQAFVTTTGATVGLADLNWYGTQIKQLLSSFHIQPNTFPIFLTSNVFLYQGNPKNCCVIGLHGITRSTGLGTQTYVSASYIDPGIFPAPLEDVDALSHEVAEWYNDPFTHNVVPPWNVVSQLQGSCNDSLEVGEPLIGVAFTINGYHLQDEASFSWFARQTPSLNQNGHYSYLGTFTSAAPVCSQAGTWSPTGNLVVARFNPRLTTLRNGLVLLEGGNAPGSYTIESELFDPKTGIWYQTGKLHQGRTEHSATLLPNGEVLVAGGYAGPVLNSAEVYNFTTGLWTPTGSMSFVRTRHTATLLPDGKVLVAGGWDGHMLSSAELYDPTTGMWSSAGTMATTLADQTATLLPNGKVLVAGGAPDNNLETGESELYDPATNTWSVTGSLNVPRAGHTAVLLPDGNVLVVGGMVDATGTPTSTAELYNPTTGTWTLTGSMSQPRSALRDNNAQLLSDGTVLMAGGDTAGTSEMYSPSTGTWSFPISMGQKHCAAGSALLSDGRVLIAAGMGCDSLDTKGDLVAIYTPGG